MTKLHHATAARAEKESVRMEFDETHHIWVAFDSDTGSELSNHANAKVALDDAIKVRASTDAVVETTEDDERDEDGAEVVDETEEDDEKDHGSIVPSHYKEQYGEEQHNGDPIAVALRGNTSILSKGKKGGTKVECDQQALLNIAMDHGFNPLELWPNLNPGQWRMNTGNKLRGLVSKGEQVEIGGTIFTIDSMPDHPRWNAARARLAKAKAKAEAKAKQQDEAEMERQKANAEADEAEAEIIADEATDALNDA